MLNIYVGNQTPRECPMSPRTFYGLIAVPTWSTCLILTMLASGIFFPSTYDGLGMPYLISVGLIYAPVSFVFAVITTIIAITPKGYLAHQKPPADSAQLAHTRQWKPRVSVGCFKYMAKNLFCTEDETKRKARPCLIYLFRQSQSER